MPSNEQFKVVRVSCSSCGGNLRNHDILREFSTAWEDDDTGIEGGTDYQICQCKGCETVRFRKASWDASEIDPETGEPEIFDQIYPEVSRSRGLRTKNG